MHRKPLALAIIILFMSLAEGAEARIRHHHRSRSHTGHSYSYGHGHSCGRAYGSGGYRYGYGGWGYRTGGAWGGWSGAQYGPWSYGLGTSPSYDLGAIDADVTPESAHLVVDGEDVGEADDYDGFPGHLLLPSGEHRIEIRAKGRETVVLDVDLQPGWLLRLEDELERGDPATERYRDMRPPSRYEDEERTLEDEPSSGDEPRSYEQPDDPDDASMNAELKNREAYHRPRTDRP